MAADGPAFVAAAVKAACEAKAPRRTVQAVAAAVAGVFAHQHASAIASAKDRVKPAAKCAADLVRNDDEDTPALIEALRSARRAQRKRKKERRRAAKVLAAAETAKTSPEATVYSGPPATGEQAATVGTLPQGLVLKPLPTASHNLPRSESVLSSRSNASSAWSVQTKRPPSPGELDSAPRAATPRISTRDELSDAHMPQNLPGLLPRGK